MYERQTPHTSQVVRDHYPSMASALHFALVAPVNPVQQQERRNLAERQMNKGTTGPGPGLDQWLSFKGCLDVFTAGKTDGIVRAVAPLREQLGKLRTDKVGAWVQPRPRRVRVRAAVGDELHITEAMQGRHDTAWSTTKRDTRTTAGRPRFATVHMGLTMASSDDASAVLWRAAVAAQVVDMLQTSGMHVELILSCCSLQTYESDNRRSEITLTAKDYNTPLSAEAVATMASAGFFRAAFFHLIACNSIGSAPGWGYGRPDHEREPELIKERRADGALVINIPAATNSRDAAERVLTDAAKALAESSKQLAA